MRGWNGPRSRGIQSALDARVALEAGGAKLPGPVKLAMKLTSKVMTKSVYYV